MNPATVSMYDLFSSFSGNTHQPNVAVTLTQSITVTGNVMQWVYSGLGIVGLINNLFVVFVILKTESMRKEPRNWFIFHQSFADIICATFVLAALAKDATMKVEVQKK